MATVVLAAGTSSATSSEITVSSDPVTVCLFTDSTAPIKYGVVLKVKRKNNLEAYEDLAVPGLGKVLLKNDLTCIQIVAPGDYVVVRPDITGFAQNVGVEVE